MMSGWKEISTNLTYNSLLGSDCNLSPSETLKHSYKASLLSANERFQDYRTNDLEELIQALLFRLIDYCSSVFFLI